MTMKLESFREYISSIGKVQCQFNIGFTHHNSVFIRTGWNRTEFLSDLEWQFKSLKTRIKNNSKEVILRDMSGTSRIHQELNDQYLPIFLRFM